MKKAIPVIVIVLLVALASTFAVWKYEKPSVTSTVVTTPLTASTSSIPVTIANKVDPATLSRFQGDLQGITPYFVDSRSFDGKPLTPQEEQIKNDIVAVLVSNDSSNTDYYSQLWPRFIGTRYVLVSQPTADGYYEILIDSQTGESTTLQNAASYATHYFPLERSQPASNGRQTVLYIGYQDIYTYTLDQGSFALVMHSKLSGSETYHNGRGDFSLQPDETHTDDSIQISIFDSSQVVQNPYAQPNAIQTMNKKIREVALAY